MLARIVDHISSRVWRPPLTLSLGATQVGRQISGRSRDKHMNADGAPFWPHAWATPPQRYPGTPS